MDRDRFAFPLRLRISNPRYPQGGSPTVWVCTGARASVGLRDALGDRPRVGANPNEAAWRTPSTRDVHAYPCLILPREALGKPFCR